jgi:hypothetical protein
MAENKTKPTEQSVADYLASVENPTRKADAEAVCKLMEKATGEKPVMWGPSIVGFGSYHYIYASGREGDTLRVGFSARKPALVLYGLVFYNESHPENHKLLAELGPTKQGKGCLYVKSLEALDVSVLEKMIKNAFHHKAQ